MERKALKIRELTLGDGIPKICIPITARDRRELEEQAARLLEGPCDLAEWRADFYWETEKENWVAETLAVLRERLGERPLLFTFRTRGEGGERAVSLEEYERLNEKAAQSGFADLIDVELNRGRELLQRLAEQAHGCGVRVVGSYHDFKATPGREEIVRILCAMQSLGADISKAALMPQSEQDVMELLEATLEMKLRYADRPYITMSMGRLGAVSRLCGALTGSAVTFATAGRASAPGQMDAELVARVRAAM